MAALRTSWRRDRWVSRRRLWFRWTVWGLQRYALQISGGVIAVGALAWLAAAPWRTTETGARSDPPITQAPSQAPAANETTTPLPAPSPANTQAPTSEMQSASPPLPLRLERAWNGTATLATRPAASIETISPDSTPIPKLKPENWLHSKEP